MHDPVSPRVGLVGATGVVGETILRVLEERSVPVGELLAYASRDRDEAVRVPREDVPVRAATRERLLRRGCNDVVFFASSDDASAEMAKRSSNAGGIVIDNSATFRMDPNAPAGDPRSERRRRSSRTTGSSRSATAPRSCSASGSRRSRDAAGLRSVRVATYQAVSGAGRAGLEALAAQEDAALRDGAAASNGPFAAPIFRNVVPQIGSFDALGDTGEEKKVVAETRKMLELPEPPRRGDDRARAGALRAQRSGVHRDRTRDVASTNWRGAAGRPGRRVPCGRDRHAARGRGHRISCTSRACAPRAIPSAHFQAVDRRRPSAQRRRDQRRADSRTPARAPHGRARIGSSRDRHHRSEVRRVVAGDAGVARHCGFAGARSQGARGVSGRRVFGAWAARPIRTPPTRCSG